MVFPWQKNRVARTLTVNNWFPPPLRAHECMLLRCTGNILGKQTKAIQSAKQESSASNFQSKNSQISIVGPNNQIIINNPPSEQPGRSITGDEQSDQPTRSKSEGICIMIVELSHWLT